MTCIVGYIDKAKKKMYMGGDSAGVSGHMSYSRKDEKVFSKGKMLFGFTSSFRMGQLLRYSLAIPEKDEGMSDYEYMCTKFVESIRSTLKTGGFSHVENNEESGGTFLVAFNGELYSIFDDFQVGVNILNYNSCGCGEYWANGALYKRNGEPIKLINLALETASYFSGWVKPPFNIIEMSY
jgi:hypothetical protein